LLGQEKTTSQHSSKALAIAEVRQQQKALIVVEN
jgi:hypothetical protein